MTAAWRVTIGSLHGYDVTDGGRVVEEEPHVAEQREGARAAQAAQRRRHPPRLLLLLRRGGGVDNDVRASSTVIIKVGWALVGCASRAFRASSSCERGAWAARRLGAPLCFLGALAALIGGGLRRGRL